METLPHSGQWVSAPRAFYPKPQSTYRPPQPQAFYPAACERPASTYRPRWG